MSETDAIESGEVQIPNDIDDAPVVDFPDDAKWDDFQVGVNYVGTVDQVKNYGLFVRFTPQYEYDMSMLVHKSQLGYFERTHEFTVGQYVVVTPLARRSDDEVSGRLVDTMWDKDLDDLDTVETYHVDGYQNLAIGDNYTDVADGVNRLGDVATVEETEPSEGSDEAEEPEVEADGEGDESTEEEEVSSPPPKPDTKIADVLQTVVEADEPVTSGDVNDRLDTENTATQLRVLTERGHVHREAAPDDPNANYQYLSTPKGVEALSDTAEASDDEMAVNPGNEEGSALAATDGPDEAMSDEDEDGGRMESARDPNYEPMPVDLDLAIERLKRAHREGGDLQYTDICRKNDRLSVTVEMGVGDDDV